MGQNYSIGGGYFTSASVKDHFAAIQTLWSDDDYDTLVKRLKDMTLNFSLDKLKFAKLLQLSSSYEALVTRWFEEFSSDRASQVADGLEFLAAAIMISSGVQLFRKIMLLFSLFDLDKTGSIRRDEFTIFLKATTTGLHRMVSGLPPPASVMDLGSVAAELCGALGSQVLAQKDFVKWIAQAHHSLYYLSVLSKLLPATFAWGANFRHQLGLHPMEPSMHQLPTPLLGLEGKRVICVASHESHTLILTEEGAVWSCGSGHSGILGHGDVSDSPAPRVVEALAHTRVVAVAVGVRHSVAISDKGQVFTWGAANLGQLGHGSIDDREVHEWAHCPKTGGSFVYVARPTVVMGLFGRKVLACSASCSNFSTAVLTEQGEIYSWGNNTDGQCGQGQRCPDHKLVFVDPHMYRTAMQAIFEPRLVATSQRFARLVGGGYHTLAVDTEHRLWTWGQGLWGKLGHGDQRSMYEPKMVDTLRHHVTKDVAAGESHSVSLITLYKLTITAGPGGTSLSPFCLLGLPIGRPDRHMEAVKPSTPPGTSLQLKAFASAGLYQVGLPFRHDKDSSVINPERHSLTNIHESVVLMDRSLWEGDWLKLSTTDFDFNVVMASSGAQVSVKTGVTAPILYPPSGQWETDVDLAGKICVLDLAPRVVRGESASQEELAQAAVELAQDCLRGRGVACLCVLPPNKATFCIGNVPGAEGLKSLAYGVMSHEHGEQLRKHLARLVQTRAAASPGESLEEMRNWRECREDFTGRTYYENTVTGVKRWAPPQVLAPTEATLVIVREDAFLLRLRALLDCKPKGIIVIQQSWRPDVELVALTDSKIDLERLDVPIAMVTYEAGEELKTLVANGSKPWVSMEVQPYGGVCAWGHGTKGQLGLESIENQNFLLRTQNPLTQEENTFVNRPCYVAHLHEHQVLNIACGSAHTAVATQHGEVFTWGVADGLGVAIDRPSSDVPVCVEQLDGLAKAKKVFAGYHHTFAIAEMPFRSIV